MEKPHRVHQLPLAAFHEIKVRGFFPIQLHTVTRLPEFVNEVAPIDIEKIPKLGGLDGSSP